MYRYSSHLKLYHGRTAKHTFEGSSTRDLVCCIAKGWGGALKLLILNCQASDNPVATLGFLRIFLACYTNVVSDEERRRLTCFWLMHTPAGINFPRHLLRTLTTIHPSRTRRMFHGLVTSVVTISQIFHASISTATTASMTDVEPRVKRRAAKACELCRRRKVGTVLATLVSTLSLVV